MSRNASKHSPRTLERMLPPIRTLRALGSSTTLAVLAAASILHLAPADAALQVSEGVGYVEAVEPPNAPVPSGAYARLVDRLQTFEVHRAAAERRADLRAAERRREAIEDLVARHRLTAEPAWRTRLAEAVHDVALDMEVDPLIAAAIVAKESSFKSQIVSRAGAVGLMQLRPFVARDVARRHGIEWRGVETLHDPETNVRLGLLYFKELLDHFDGDARKALTAYNYGPTRVRAQIRKGTYRGSDYADRILALYARESSKVSDDA